MDVNSNNPKTTTSPDRPINKRLEFLLEQSEIFSHFMNNSGETKSNMISHSKITESKKDQERRYRKTEHQEDVEQLAEAKTNTVQTFFDESPKFIAGGKMRDYQVSGLNWMISLYENHIGGILADEMGLGKTLQTISILGYMKHYRNDEGPHLVIVPKSTLQNWLNEFAKWCPILDVRVFLGDKTTRRTQMKDLAENSSWNVLVTTYEMVTMESNFFFKIKWNYLIMDEAQRIKNEKSLLAVAVRTFDVKNRLLLTGTPLQNNLHELWALLNFLLPDLFSSSVDFDQWFDSDNCLGDMTLVMRLHTILKPFMLRRIKSEVESNLLPKKELKIFVGLSKMQRDCYKKILLKDLDVINGLTGNSSKMRMLNMVMHLRKCCNHPYLFDGVEEGPPYTTDTHLVKNCGKMIVLDKLLVRLKAQGSRVLIFSQMTRVLDIVEDYCVWKGWSYHRLDGQTGHQQRSESIAEFNSPGSSTFIFMLSTKAGGLGINLASADSVIIYDSDWNPQNDLQAMDRAHRIGQKKQVHVFRLITENTVDEKIVERAEMKLRLDKLVIQQGKLPNKSSASANADEMMHILRFGAKELMASNDEDDASLDYNIEQFLSTGEARTKEQQLRLDGIANDYASSQSFTLNTHSNLFLFEGTNFKQMMSPVDTFIELPKRNRKPVSYHNTVESHQLRKLLKIDVESCGKRANRRLVLMNDQENIIQPLSELEIEEMKTLMHTNFIDYAGNHDKYESTTADLYIAAILRDLRFGKNSMLTISIEQAILKLPKSKPNTFVSGRITNELQLRYRRIMKGLPAEIKANTSSTKKTTKTTDRPDVKKRKT